MNKFLETIRNELVVFAEHKLGYSEGEREALLQGVSVGFYGGTAEANFQKSDNHRKAWEVGFAVGTKIKDKEKQA